MYFVFFFLLFASLFALIVGLVKPTLFSRIKITNRKLVLFVFGGLFITSIVGFAITAPPVIETEQKADQPQTTEKTTPTSQETTQPVQQEAVKQTNDGLFLVTRVIDGDTIEIEGGQRVRYIGIDTPETVDPRKPVQCFGVEASNKNKELVSGQRVRLEKDISETDRYGRLLRYVYVGNTFVNLELVRQGYAYASSYPPDIKYQSQFTSAQNEARGQNTGLWGSCPITTQTSAPTATPTPTTQSTQPPSSCDIKGNIASDGEKIYHVPGCASYNVTKIDEPRGEKWFCSEQEALAAGWRKALNCP